MNPLTVKYERERIAACIAQARVHAKRMRQFMRPGVVDSVASMLESDLEQAEDRVQWLRERASEDMAA